MPEGNKNFLSYAFTDLLNDTAFANTYNKLVQINKAKEPKPTDLENSPLVKKVERVKIEDYSDIKNYNSKCDCYALGVDKLIVLNPFYIRMDERKKEPLLFVSGEYAQNKFNEKIKDMSDEAGVDVELLDKNKSANIDAYNDIAVLTDWISERLDHGKIQLLPTDYNRIAEISKKYGTDYLAIAGAVNYVFKKQRKAAFILISVILPVYSWPFTLPYLLKKNSVTQVYTVVFNMKTGDTEMSKLGNAPFGDRYDVLYSFLYDYLLQIKRKGLSNNK